MKFEDILFLMQTGSAFAAMAGHPEVGAFVNLGTRLFAVGKAAYENGRARGEWTAEQARQFDEEILPKMFAQDHWQKK